MVNSGHAGTRALRGEGRFEFGHLVIDQDGTAIGLVDPGHDFDQRRFTGTILTQQRVYFASPYIELHILECFDARKGFADTAQLNDWWHETDLQKRGVPLPPERHPY